MTTPENDDPQRGQIDVEFPCVFEGQAIRVSLRCPAMDLAAALRYLAKHGIEPERAPLQFEWTAEGLPLCPKHGVPMAKRERFGKEWYAHNAGTKERPAWCRGFPDPRTTGYDQP